MRMMEWELLSFTGQRGRLTKFCPLSLLDTSKMERVAENKLYRKERQRNVYLLCKGGSQRKKGTLSRKREMFKPNNLIKSGKILNGDCQSRVKQRYILYSYSWKAKQEIWERSQGSVNATDGGCCYTTDLPSTLCFCFERYKPFKRFTDCGVSQWYVLIVTQMHFKMVFLTIFPIDHSL